MRKRDRVALYCFIAFSFFVIAESFRFGLGSLRHPGPGFLPFLCAAIIAVFAISLLAIGKRGKAGSQEPFFKKERLPKFLVVVFILFGYALLLSYLGFILCTGLFVLISLKTIEPKSWGRAITISLLTAFVCWAIFDYWLKIQAPEGTWISPLLERGFLWK